MTLPSAKCGIWNAAVQGYDIIEEMYSPKSAAANFVHELCSTRPKGNLEALMHQVCTTKLLETDITHL